MLALPQELKMTFLLAMVVSFLLVISIIFVVYIYNKKQLFFKKEKELQDRKYENQVLQLELDKRNAIAQERERISHDMHDDLGAGISALKLQVEFIKRKLKDQPELIQDIEELLFTSEEMNYSMREILWSLDNKNDTLQNFVAYSKKHVNHFLKKSAIKIEIEENGILPEIRINSLARRNLYLCIKESFNNIYKHSCADCAFLSFTFIRPKLHIMVQDNGVGLPDHISEGNGLKNMSFRMNDINGDFSYNSSDNGTELHFTVNI